MFLKLNGIVDSSQYRYILGNFAEISVKEYYFVLAWLACEAISDTAIAASMVLLLRRQRTGFSRYVRRCELFPVNLETDALGLLVGPTT